MKEHIRSPLDGTYKTSRGDCAGQRTRDDGIMSAIERIAFHRGRRDEVPNQELARQLAETRDAQGIKVIAEHLWDRNKSIASDCIKVLYEIGYIDPGLIEAYTEDFIRLLGSRHNRMVWGGMIALWTVADSQYELIWEHVDEVVLAVERGSVITVVTGVKALAVVASKDTVYEERLRPLLFGILRECEAKRVPSHGEDMLVMVNDDNREEFLSLLVSRMDDLSPAQVKRVDKLISSF